jgi:hypothetical protein
METAVDWLVRQLLNGKPLMPSLIEQAKEMEKDQITGAYQADVPMCSDGDAEEYYNTIFSR